MALESTSWTPPAPPGWPAGRIADGRDAPEMGRMGTDIVLPHSLALAGQVDGTLDHIFHRRDGGNVGSVAARGAHQVDHVLGGVDFRKGHVAVLIGVRVTRQ